jgi:hypothetical protein
MKSPIKTALTPCSKDGPCLPHRSIFSRVNSLLLSQTVKTHIDSDEKQTKTISAFILEEGMSQKI